MMVILILLFYLIVFKDVGIIYKLYLVEFCILLFSCIFVVYWYEINKWIDDYDKVFVLILNKKGNIFIVYISMYCFFYLFIFCMSLYIYFFF